MDEPFLWLGTLACTLAAAAGLLPLRTRLRLASLSFALLLAPVLVLADNWRSERLASVTDRPGLLVAAMVATAVVIALLALLLRPRPWLLAPLLVAALPFRIPVDLGDGSSNLLIPLYVVIASGLLAALAAAWRGEGEPPWPATPRALRFVAPVLAAWLVLYALQAAYADDASVAAHNVAFFLAPFAALYALLSSSRWDAATVKAVVGVLAVEGLIFALVAAGQYVSGELLWNEKVIEGNEAHQYFRVNSLFWDPNILGRYLAVTMIVIAGIVAYGRELLTRRLAVGLFVVLLGALVVSFSQTSMIALIAGLLVLLALRWGVVRGAVAGVAVLVALAAAVVLLASGGLSEDVDSGRSGLIDGGIEIAVDHPLLGVGSGGFAGEFEVRFYEGVGFAVESHTEPVTVAAEQGAIGLLVYLALLGLTVGGLLVLCRPRALAPALGPPIAAVLCAAYLAMIVHSMGYAAFLADPLTWAILAVAVGALGAFGRWDDRSSKRARPGATT